MKRVLSYVRPYMRYVLIGPIFKLAEAVLELILPMIMKNLVDNGINAGNESLIWTASGQMLVVSVLGLLTAWVCQYSGSRAGQGYGTDIRNALFKHINTLSQAEIKRFGVSSLINRITNDSNQLQTAVALGIRLLVRAPFILIGSFVMCAMLDWHLAMIVLIAAPVFALIIVLIMRKNIPMSRMVQQRLDRLGLVLSENLSGVRVIRAFARQKEEKERFDEANEGHASLARQVGAISALANPATMFIMNMAIAAIIWFGGFRVNSGTITTGTLVAFVNYMIEMISTLVVVADLVLIFTRSYASAKRVEEILETESSIRSGTEALRFPENMQGERLICFDRVDFRYPDGAENALEDIDFCASAGQTIGIIGGTGSGKSSLVSLISRIYDVTDGSIQLLGMDLRDYKLDDLRQSIAVVPQKSLLVRGTVAENLRWAKADASEEALWQALEAAQAGFIRDKQGLETKVERGGANFSGGQRQRLAIARALVRRPKILILDDSSSALDFATDYALRGALKRYAEDMTLFIVSQRVSSIMFSDKILMMDDGRIVGQGNHDELMADCGLYSEIVRMQIEDAEVE